MEKKFFDCEISTNKILGGKARFYDTPVNVPEMGNNGSIVKDVHYDDNNNGIVDPGEQVCAL